MHHAQYLHEALCLLEEIWATLGCHLFECLTIARPTALIQSSFSCLAKPTTDFREWHLRPLQTSHGSLLLKFFAHVAPSVLQRGQHVPCLCLQ